MNVHEGIGADRSVSNIGTWRRRTRDSVASANIRLRTRPAGIIASDNGQEIGAFLSEFYDVHCYTQHDVKLTARHLDPTELQFVILGWINRELTLEALAWIRAMSNLPAIVTGPASESECVAALEGGAADYMVAPVGRRELLARIRAVLRYHQPLAKRRKPAEACVYEFGEWRYDAQKRRLMAPHGLNVALTRSECDLLSVFLKIPERVVTRESLLRATRITPDVLDRSIDVRILRLRRKLSAAAPGESIISTERGAGYRFAMPVKRHSFIQWTRKPANVKCPA
jgi:two-component system OmpR family response regulator